MLRKFTCPHCKEESISFWRKMCLGPAIPATCKRCGKKVGVPFLSMFAIAPFIISILLAPEFDSALVQTGIIFLGFSVYLLLHIKMVPLEAK